MSDSKHRSAKLHGDRPAASSERGYLDRKELAASAFERTRMPMLVTDAQQPDFPIVLANQAFLNLTGYSAEEVVGRNCRFLQGQGTSPAAIAEIRFALAHEREANVELLNYRKDGSAFWNQLHLSPIRDDDGRLFYYFGSQIDVTEYRKVQYLEATEHRLLKEVDHRAKNVLAVVEGIVRLSRSDDAALYAASIQQRIQALSHAHALLAERGWQEIELGEIIKRQVETFASERVSMEGPEILVPAAIVQPLALVVHELLINAAVHGSLSAPSGQLNIHWQKVPGQGGFKLRWQETGGRPPSSHRQPGFGTAMVGAMIEKQLLGKVDREWSDDGVVVDIVVPMDS
nr:PAS domain-containing protein [Phyllobacterium bourgognense]